MDQLKRTPRCVHFLLVETCMLQVCAHLNINSIHAIAPLNPMLLYNLSTIVKPPPHFLMIWNRNPILKYIAQWQYLLCIGLLFYTNLDVFNSNLYLGSLFNYNRSKLFSKLIRQSWNSRYNSWWHLTSCSCK